MNLQSTFLPTTNTNLSETRSVLQQLPRYILCAGWGVLGGATGVALTVGLAIVIHVWLSPSMTFRPGVMWLAIAATLVGLGVSWLLGRMARYPFPSLSCKLDKLGLQLILVFSAVTSLLQTFLYMHVW